MYIVYIFWHSDIYLGMWDDFLAKECSCSSVNCQPLPFPQCRIVNTVTRLLHPVITKAWMNSRYRPRISSNPNAPIDLRSFRYCQNITFTGKSHFPEIKIPEKANFPRSYLIIIFLPKVPLIQPKIGIIWSYSTKYHQLPEIPLFHPKIAIIWSY